VTEAIIGYDRTVLEAEGLTYGDDFGVCDLCGRAEPWADLTPDWNGDTGNHYSCEQSERENAAYERGVIRRSNAGVHL